MYVAFQSGAHSCMSHDLGVDMLQCVSLLSMLFEMPRTLATRAFASDPEAETRCNPANTIGLFYCIHSRVGLQFVSTLEIIFRDTQILLCGGGIGFCKRKTRCNPTATPTLRQGRNCIQSLYLIPRQLPVFAGY